MATAFHALLPTCAFLNKRDKEDRHKTITLNK